MGTRKEKMRAREREGGGGGRKRRKWLEGGREEVLVHEPGSCEPSHGLHNEGGIEQSGKMIEDKE